VREQAEEQVEEQVEEAGEEATGGEGCHNRPGVPIHGRHQINRLGVPMHVCLFGCTVARLLPCLGHFRLYRKC